MRKVLLIAAVVVSLPSAARAWDPLGHMLTMRLAQDQLTPETRKAVEESIARFNAAENPDAPYDLITAACWMDDARARTKEFNEWHYVNLPFTPDGLPLPDGSAAAPHVIWGIDHCTDVIAGRVEDPTLTKDQALMILLHLAGDVHQPLHTTSRDDLGGNRTPVANLDDAQVDLLFSRGGNLHFYWDSAYRRMFSNAKAGVEAAAPIYPRQTPVRGHLAARPVVDKLAAGIAADFPEAKNENGGGATDWALESHALGYAMAYGHLPAATGPAGVELDAEYVSTSRAIARLQLARAGARIAVLLNALYGPATN